MALGKTHELINLLVLPGFLYFLPKEFYLSFSVGYLLDTFLLSPDLDLKHSAPYYCGGARIQIMDLLRPLRYNSL
ncbi:DUF2227 family putative metal-binding protein [Thermocrinis sp.]|uniref:DUF2227 family putative metal-binding protein n=1 Tax=Thermocrinis sp. TaxID=2024383 RepID=UPI003C05E2D3